VSNLRPDAWLKWLDHLPADLERHAIPSDHARRERGAVLMAGLSLPHQELYPWGLEAGHRLWEPWAEARRTVEALDLEAEAAQVDWILHDREAGTVTLALLAPLPAVCPRFSRRECPRMVPMGHESEKADCNYWAWEGMSALTPGLELYPEWQRFDCHKYHPLFQVHLCGAALAKAVRAELKVEVFGSDLEAGKKLLDVYAGFTSMPGAFTFKSL
jgi:hypothetical protein